MRRFTILLCFFLLLVGCAKKHKQPAPKKDAPFQTTPAAQLPVEQQLPSAMKEPPPVGNFGYDPPTEEQRKEFLRTLGDKPTLRDANPELFKVEEKDSKKDKGAPPAPNKKNGGPQSENYPIQGTEPVFLYKALLAVKPGWKVGAQGIGDCVSWGWAHAADVSLAVDVKLGVSGQWKPAATEAIYGGARVEGAGRPEGSGGYSDGSYGAAAAKWVKNFGIVYRTPFNAEPYNFGYDLSNYDKSRAKSWGNYGCGGNGDRGRLDKVATDHPVLEVALVRNFEEAAAAIKNGYPVPVCSGQGFSSSRDKDGFAQASGSWSHCMCFNSVRYLPRPGLLCQNSWGNFNSGPKYPDDMPDGSFWVEASVVNRMLSGNDSYAVSRIKGFPKRKLEHSKGW